MDYGAMANEELAVRAKSGDKEAESILWGNVYRLIQKLTRRYLTLCPAAGIEPEDMMQDCWIGFHNAVMGYQPGRSLFTSYLGFHIKKVCMNALHIQNGKIRHIWHGARIMDSPRMSMESGGIWWNGKYHVVHCPSVGINTA